MTTAPTFSDTFIEKSKATQCLHHASIFGFRKTLLLIGNILGIILKVIWISYPEDIKISHLSTLKTCYNVSMKWTCENLPPQKSLENMTKKKRFNRKRISIGNRIIHACSKI